MNYTYDVENNRIAMESERHKESYVVDTVSFSLSRILTVTDGNGTTTLCIYGNGLICEQSGDIYHYHHYNHLGRTMKLTDAKGGVTASFTYGTYGELLNGETKEVENVTTEHPDEPVKVYNFEVLNSFHKKVFFKYSYEYRKKPIID